MRRLLGTVDGSGFFHPSLPLATLLLAVLLVPWAVGVCRILTWAMERVR